MLKVLEGPSTRRLWWRTARQCLLRPEAVLGGRLEVRHLTGTEVSTALRPFYFLVHPDLFGKYPKEQIQNEKSLKILKNYVDTLVHDKKRPNPSEVKFYMRPRGKSQGSSSLPSIKIRLRETKLRSMVVTILKSADLPTQYVDSVPDVETNTEAVPEFSDPFEDAGYPEQSSTGFSSTDKNQPLVGWLQGEISYKYELEDFVWDCGWETVHRRGVVEAFLSLVVQYPEITDIIRGRTIVFGRDSGVSISGQISLYSGEVRNNWLNIIKTTPESDKLLESLPMWERTLSQALRGIQVVSDPATIVLVENHRVRLRQLVTAVGDFMARRSLPASWPPDMSRFKILAENDSSSMMINDDGVFVLPASTPGFLIMDFITRGLEEADRKMSEWASLEKEEAFLISSCINELGLIQLDKDDNISVKHMVHCCSRLLKYASRLRHLTHGNHLVVARYYMVKSDGVICLPWDLVIDGLDSTKEQKQEHVLHLTMY